MRFFGWMFCFLCLSFCAASAYAEDCSIVRQALSAASEVRGLTIKSQVKCVIRSKDEIKKDLQRQFQKQNPSERIKNEESLYKFLGIIPENFDYAKGLVDLYVSQLAGYYDSESHSYTMPDWIPATMQYPVAVHELTHALQDQHYDLTKITKDQNASSDEMLARMALVEGDATAVMYDYARKIQGEKPLAKEISVADLLLTNLTGALLSPGASSASVALQAMMLFPYMSGLNFAHTLLVQDGYRSIDRAYKKMPSSTEEVLHPDKYNKKQSEYEKVPAPSCKGDDSGVLLSPVYQDTLGEFLISAVLKTWVPSAQAIQAAAGWAGDRASLCKRGEATVFAWSTRWDRASDAQEFFDTIVSAYTKRYGKAPRQSVADSVLFVVANQKAEVQRTEDKVVQVLIY